MDPNDTLLVVAVPAALVGAAAMGFASAAQAKATHEVPTRPVLDAGLVRDMLRNKLWIAGMLATIAGLVLQLVALRYAPLLLVQPLLITSLMFAALFSAWLYRRGRLDRMIVVGALLCMAGLSAFLLLAQPSGHASGLLPFGQLVPLALLLTALVLLGLALSAVDRGSVGVLGLALATGVFYGVTAGLMKVVAGQLRNGVTEPFQHPVLYIVCVLGPIGFLLSQNAFQRGRYVSPAVAVITTVDPLVGVAIGVWWMGETANDHPAALAGECLAAVVIITGVAMLAKRATHLSHAAEADSTAAETPAVKGREPDRQPDADRPPGTASWQAGPSSRVD